MSLATETVFRQGYYLAVANVMRLHGEDTVAADVLKEFGPVDFDQIDEFDLEILKPLAAELRRKKRARSPR